MKNRYTKDDKVHDIILRDYNALQIMARFALPLGVGEKTVRQVCQENHVDTETFLAVLNFTVMNERPDENTHISLKALASYLRSAHTYFLSYLMPQIRSELISALHYSEDDEISSLILKFYDEYFEELRRHMSRENDLVFPYVEELLEGRRGENSLDVKVSIMHQEPLEAKLGELINIIVKYYQSDPDNINVINSVLQRIFNFREDMRCHCDMEEQLFAPEVRKLEDRLAQWSENDVAEDSEDDSVELTDREKDIIICVVKGMTAKEISDRLFISVNTVTTHRRNIARKLDIHTASGLTIYAIINHLVNIRDIKL